MILKPELCSRNLTRLYQLTYGKTGFVIHIVSLKVTISKNLSMTLSKDLLSEKNKRGGLQDFQLEQLQENSC